jgi:hypothetical protein
LRINRFNLTDDPVHVLNDRLFTLVNGRVKKPELLNDIQDTIVSLQNKELKECSKCKEYLPLSDFQDSSLVSGIGKICKKCKGFGYVASHREAVLCPDCGGVMVPRKGRYGEFWGCSLFPRCYGTRKKI